MTMKIKEISEKDREDYLQMAKEFYSMSCCDHSVDSSHFENAFDFCLTQNPYSKIFILQYDGQVAGYANIAFTYSIEAGGKVVLLEELFIKEQFRGKGLGRTFFEYVETNYPAKRYRLEVTDCNVGAKKLYEKLGYSYLNYLQMLKDKN